MRKILALIICIIAVVMSLAFARRVAAIDSDATEINLPVIMYHSTFRKNPGAYNVTPAQLEADLIYLKERGYQTVVMRDILNFQQNGQPLPQKPIMLTFDDGYENNYLYAFPLFQKHGMRCVMSVVGKLTDDNYHGDETEPTRAHVTYEQIREMSESGLVEIQNHTYDMHRLGKRRGLGKRKGESVAQYEKALTDDLLRWQKQLKERAGVEPEVVVYPFGCYSRETAPILKKLGFKGAFCCRNGINKITQDSDLFLIKRNNRPSGKSAAAYFSKLGIN